MLCRAWAPRPGAPRRRAHFVSNDNVTPQTREERCVAAARSAGQVDEAAAGIVKNTVGLPVVGNGVSVEVTMSREGPRW